MTVEGKGNYEGAAEATFAIRLAKAKRLKVACTAAKGISAKWAKVEGAKKYQVQYRVRGGKWKTKSVRAAKATIRSLKPGRLYDVRVRAVVGKSKGAWSAVGHRRFAQQAGAKARGKKPAAFTAAQPQAKPQSSGYSLMAAAL